MNNLNLPNPKMMDVAVPANLRIGLPQEDVARTGWALTPRKVMGSSTARTWSSSTFVNAAASARSTGRSRVAARALPGPAGERAAGGGCSTSLQPRPANASCSTAPSASAPRWPCRPRRMRGVLGASPSPGGGGRLEEETVRSCTGSEASRHPRDALECGRRRTTAPPGSRQGNEHRRVVASAGAG